MNREQLVRVVQDQAAQLDVCGAAEALVLDSVLTERLAELGVRPSPDAAVTLMAVAMLLAERSPEFGGDARDALGLVARLGLNLLSDAAGG